MRMRRGPRPAPAPENSDLVGLSAIIATQPSLHAAPAVVNAPASAGAAAVAAAAAAVAAAMVADVELGQPPPPSPPPKEGEDSQEDARMYQLKSPAQRAVRVRNDRLVAVRRRQLFVS